jgi:hypothetical protein
MGMPLKKRRKFPAVAKAHLTSSTSPNNVAREFDLFEHSVTMALNCYDGAMSGSIEIKQIIQGIAACRMIQGAARGMLAARLAAGKLAFQEAKLVNSASSMRAVRL